MDAFSALSANLEIVWEAVGMEILIFTLTLFFAAVLRNAGQVPPNKPQKSSKLHVEAMPLKPKPKAATQCSPMPPASWQPVAQRRSVSPEAEPRRLARLVDEIVMSVRAQPGTRAAAWALGQYSELRQELQRSSISMQHISKFARSPALDLFHTLISSAVRCGQGYLISSLIEDMVRLGVPRPMSLYESAMKQLAGQKQHQQALEVYDRMAEDGFKPSTVTCSCLVNFAAEAGDSDRAIEFFRKLQALTTPSIRAYMTILRVHCRRADWPSSLAILQDMEERGVALDSLTLNVALATCVATENFQAAEDLLESGLKATPRVSDVVSCNTVIKGYAARGDPTGALRILERMQKRGLRPNAITMNTVMDAAVRSNKLDEAWAVLDRMRSLGMTPDKFTCTILVKGVRKTMQTGSCRAVMDVLQEVGDGCEPSLRNSLHNTLLDAALSIPDHTLSLHVASRMRSAGIPVSEAATRRMRDMA